MSKVYISQFFRRDQQAFTAMSKCGHITSQHMKECNVVESRIKNYVRDGLVERVAYKTNTTTDYAYKLTRHGREVAERNWGVNNHYHAQSPKHDISIANKYFSLSERERETWKTETELRENFAQKLRQLKEQGEEETAKLYEEMLEKGLISMPDASYEAENGIQVAYEVITNNYGKQELQAKEAYVEVVKCKYEVERV